MSTANTSNRDALRITEIFYSLQGEARTVGLPTVFVRLTGCPLRCVYCDTAYAFSGGDMVSITEVTAQVAEHQPRYVTVTGGEPLVRKDIVRLVELVHRRTEVEQLVMTTWPSPPACRCWCSCVTPATRYLWRPAARCRWPVWIREW